MFWSTYICWTRAHLIACFEVLISVGRARTLSYVLSAYILRGLGVFESLELFLIDRFVRGFRVVRVVRVVSSRCVVFV